MEIEHRLLRSFVRLVEEGSFTVAADKLFLSQPALSAQIQRLEKHFGVGLVHRSGRRGAFLTDAGSALLPFARQLLRLGEQAQAAVQETRRRPGETRTLRLGALGAVHGMPTSMSLQLFREVEPDLSVTVVGFSYPDQLTCLTDDRADVAWVWPPYDPDSIAGIVLHPLARMPRAALLPAGHRLARRSHLRVAELAGLPAVGFAPAVDPVFVDHWTLARELGPRPSVGAAVTMDDSLDLIELEGCTMSAAVVFAATQPRTGIAAVPLVDASSCTLCLAHAEGLPPHYAEAVQRYLPALRRIAAEITGLVLAEHPHLRAPVGGRGARAAAGS